MAVDSSFESMLFQNLKIDEPWLPPKPWESIQSESGSGRVGDASLPPSSAACDSSYHPSSLSEESLVRLVMNALQGVQSALISIQKLSESFYAIPADRSALRVPSLWNRSLSTSVLGEILKSIGYSGCLVFLLQNFVEYFIDLSFNETRDRDDRPSLSLVNHAFAVALGKILEGYACGLNTLTAAACLRRSMENADELSNDSSRLGCLKSVVHSRVTVLEVYLHSKELRTRIEALGNLCNLCDAALCYSVTPMDDLLSTAIMEFCNFPRGGYLLTYLYDQLQVIDPVNSSLLKFLFLRSLEPYWGFVRSWIYEAKISDPHGEFIIKHDASMPAYSHGKAGVYTDITLAIVREKDGISVPCFLKNLIIPMLRAGQQLQVVMKLLDVCKYIVVGEYAFVDVLPGSADSTGYEVSYKSPLSFDRRKVESVEFSRKAFYSRMLEKLENVMKSLEIKYQQETFHDEVFLRASNFGETVDAYFSSDVGGALNFSSDSNEGDSVETAQNADSETNSMTEDFGSEGLESSDCSSTDGSVEQNDPVQPNDMSEESYLSTLRFSSDVVMGHSSREVSHSHEKNSTQSGFLHACSDIDLSFKFIDPLTYATRDGVIDFGRTEQPSGSWLPEIKYPSHEYHLRRHIRSQVENLSESCKQNIAETGQHVPENGQDALDCFSLAEQCGSKKLVDNTEHLSNSYIFQSWNNKLQSNVLSMNPILRKGPFSSPPAGSRDQESMKNSKSLSFFDFSSVADLLKLCQQRHNSGSLHYSEYQNPTASVVKCVDANQGRQDDYGSFMRGKSYFPHTDSNLNSNRGSIDVLPEVACGGSAPESMVSGASDSIGNRGCDPRAIFEMPLDFVIDKCLLQEILLQYNYVSRLTIELLEKVFDLQQHFLALRRYYFMEKADWANMFVTSLWHHNWCFNEVERRTSEAQRLLESSIQRSSCERDAYKNRLYVYDRSQSSSPVLASAVGVHSFNFIGLGYRAEWPVNIILTPNALRIYAEIFSFLMQIKLAALSSTDVWHSLKDFRHIDSLRWNQHQTDGKHFNVLMKLRHQVDHFISILQQYMLSQLSDVSWGKFLRSIKREVRDMMDLESVHMSYLTASFHACFLTDEAQPILNIVASILQCALDLRSCLVKRSGNVDVDMRSSTGSLSQINISLVVSIKERFYKSMRELHSYHVKSPKHREFGLSRFWSYLNFNDFYSHSTDNPFSNYGLPGSDPHPSQLPIIDLPSQCGNFGAGPEIQKTCQFFAIKRNRIYDICVQLSKGLISISRFL